MKFLCDRCKTRYSIGDDRVRGKILKIRCKNCANVITVREGMSDVDASDPDGARKRGTTQAVPVVTPAYAAGAEAPGSAKPPPALEDEWYVSIDGQQEGPFSLAEAQRWVGGKPYDGDLHCWREGFDDWLPVDKVSHFRGLRKKPAPAPAPPPLPRAATVPARVAPAQQAAVEPEPKPLFAATMASLERNAASTAGGFGMPAPISNGSSLPSSTPAGGERAMPLQAKSNGSPMVPAIVPSIAPTAKTSKAPAVGASPTRLPTFDVADSATQIDAPSFDEPAETANDVFAKALGLSAPSPMPLATPAPSTAPIVEDDDEDEDDDLQIGEVSRVVNLADLKPSSRSKPQAAPAGPSVNNSAAALNRTGSMPRIGGNTAAVARIGGNTAAVPRLEDPNALLQPAGAGDSVVVPAQVASSHRRGMLMLIGAAAVVLIGGIVAVALLVFGGEEGPLGGLGRGNDIDTTRPDDPLRKIETGDGSGSGSQTTVTTGPVIKRPNGNGQRPQTNVLPRDPDPPVGGDRLGGEEIEAMARNNGAGTQRCYMRAQRGAEAIIIGDVKKVLATLTVAPDGTVNQVSLDKHADNTFGKCLISAIKLWKFRTSPGGTYRLTLQFVST